MFSITDEENLSIYVKINFSLPTIILTITLQMGL
jgi:hypothetical protein